ncbi:hypothetical protein SCLCIDRAFT_421795 [Scleroderma citrinum Foug A]|uniref:Uncharacterized protein n=1 Tax=Scleroderma citrinum Foug A TaxID=1036808 RepID=A0A0C3ALR4_9AGAM|nr:hypothetical protein SCLCIDRAFT_421795 [Scleroderma citrinum Foug A]
MPTDPDASIATIHSSDQSNHGPVAGSKTGRNDPVGHAFLHSRGWGRRTSRMHTERSTSMLPPFPPLLRCHRRYRWMEEPTGSISAMTMSCIQRRDRFIC